jgi:uncharacterized OB-fold protein
MMEDRVACPYCGEMNVYGSNICSACFKTIRDVANPDRAEFEQTAKTKTPSRGGLFKRIRRWWKGRRRRAE